MTASESPSRHINLWRKVKGHIGPQVYDRLDEIQAEVEAGEGRTKRRSDAVKDRFTGCLRAICLDLFHANAVDAVMLTGVHRDHNRLGKNPTYPPFVSTRTFEAALDGLYATGYVEEVSKGNEGSGKTTRVQAKPKLIQKISVKGFAKPDLSDNSGSVRLALPIGKTKRKQPTAFTSTVETAQWEANLSTINQEIYRHIIGLDRTLAQLEAIELRRREDAMAKGELDKKPYNYQRLDMDAIGLHRVFNSPNWCDGGRYYGAWWQNVPKEYRKFITIDCKDTCEHDYSGMHPRLLYAKSGHSWSIDEDPYEAPHGPELRDAVKTAFLIMLNMEGSILEKQVPEFNRASARMSWKQFVEGIAKTHAPISEFLGTGIGVQLQRLDADVAETVMLRFAQMQYACLPVHDSFITLASLGDDLHHHMKQVVMDMLGIDIGVAPKPAHTYNGPTGMVDVDISNLLEPKTDIEQRHLAWILRQDQQS